MKKLFEEKPIVSKTVSGFNYPVAVDRRPSLNICLVFLIGILGVWYALWSNFIISSQYRENLWQEKLAGLMEENNALLSEKSGSANLGALLVFSKQAGLVEHKNIEYLFDRRNVAEALLNPAR